MGVLCSYLVLFFMVFLGFVLVFHNVFGHSVYQFRQLTSTAKALLVTLLGNVDYGSIFVEFPIWSQFLFLTYVLVVFFVLLNMFIAILNESYNQAAKWADDHEEDVCQATFAMVKSGFYDALFGCFKKEPELII